MGTVRRRGPETLLLTAAFAASVGAGLTSQVVVLDGGQIAAPRLDIVVAFLPMGWPTLAALLWAPLVVWRGRAAGRSGEDPARRMVAGALLLAVAAVAGIGLGTGWALATGVPVTPGTLYWPQRARLVLKLTPPFSRPESTTSGYTA